MEVETVCRCLEQGRSSNPKIPFRQHILDLTDKWKYDVSSDFKGIPLLYFYLKLGIQDSNLLTAVACPSKGTTVLSFQILEITGSVL